MSTVARKPEPDVPENDSGEGGAWFQHMRRGEFAGAWRISDAALRERAGVPCWHWPRHLQYIWDGSPFAGRRVLVRCYHGLGDTIQFIRYMPLLRGVAAEVIVWAQPALLPLLATVRGIDRLLPLHDGVPAVDFDVDVELMELPHVFRTTLETIPRDVPYLQAERSPVGDRRPVGPVFDRPHEPARLKLGVAWRGGDWNPERDVPAPLLASLAEVPGVELHVLQDRRRTHEWPVDCGCVRCPEPVTELARVIATMDLVITVDSLPAHLAGALGVPTWTLLPVAADWRWMEARDDSPWYPTMRLWRQQRAGDWASVIERVREELRRWVKSTTVAPASE